MAKRDTAKRDTTPAVTSQPEPLDTTQPEPLVTTHTGKRLEVTTTEATKEAPTNQRDTDKKVTLDTLQKLLDTIEDILQNQPMEVTVKRGVTPEVTTQNQPVTTVTGDVTKMYLKKERVAQQSNLFSLVLVSN